MQHDDSSELNTEQDLHISKGSIKPFVQRAGEGDPHRQSGNAVIHADEWTDAEGTLRENSGVEHSLPEEHLQTVHVEIIMRTDLEVVRQAQARQVDVQKNISPPLRIRLFDTSSCTNRDSEC